MSSAQVFSDRRSRILAIATTALCALFVHGASASASPGELLAFGSNEAGQLGTTTNAGKANANPTPLSIGLPGATGPAVSLAEGEEHGLVATSSGQLYSFGANLWGQLGVAANSGTATLTTTPTPVGLPGATGGAVQVAAGRTHSLVLTSSGQLYSFGENQYGQLGRTTSGGAQATPGLVALPGATGPVAQIAAGAQHSLALTSTGQLYAFGRNEEGQLGNTTNNNTANPNETPTQVSLPGATGPSVQVAGGGDFTLVLTSTGQLYSFGENFYGQLGNGSNTGTVAPNPTPTQVSLPGATGPAVQVATGIYHSLALTSTGQVFGFGTNFNGELGTTNNLENNNANTTPTQLSLPGATGAAVQVSSGEANSMVITSTGQLFTFGYNGAGQLGSTTNNGNNKANPVPTPVALPFGTMVDTVSRGPEAHATLALTAELAILTSTLSAGQVGVPYHASAQATGAIAPFSWSAAGLPAGLSIDAGGQISGTPIAAGASNVVLHASDLFGLTATSASIPLLIAPAATPPSKPTPGSPGPTAAQLRASLFAQLSPKGKAAKIAALRKSKSYSYSFKSLSAGKLTINWYFLPPGAHLARKAKPKPVLFASGSLNFKAPETKRITVKLSAKGQKLLQRRATIKLTAKGSFAAPGRAAVTAKKPVTLKS
jgi:alpha-tubulin suppressor-like RCC1 family protein